MLKKSIFYLLIVIPIFALIWVISPIEFVNIKLARIVYLFITIFYILVLIINLNFYAFISKSIKENKSFLFFKIFINLFYGGFFYGILFLIWIGCTVCGTNEIELYYYKNDPNVKIVKRDYDCGAYDSEMSKPKIIKISPITSFLNICNDIDTNSISKNDWIKIPH